MRQHDGITQRIVLGNHPLRDHANGFIVFGLVVRGVTEMVETAFDVLKQPGMFVLDLLHGLEQQVLHGELAATDKDGIGSSMWAGAFRFKH